MYEAEVNDMYHSTCTCTVYMSKIEFCLSGVKLGSHKTAMNVPVKASSWNIFYVHTEKLAMMLKVLKLFEKCMNLSLRVPKFAVC
jgi:hypothetical protein